MFRPIPMISLFLGALMLTGPVQSGLPHQDEPVRSTPMGSGLLTLQGSTRHPMLPNAEVQISAGSATPVSGLTDTDGRLQLEFDCSDPDGLVVIKAIGTGSLAQVGAARVVHSCAQLQAEADSSGNFQVGPVTPLSTAVYAVLHWTLSDLGLQTEGISYPDVAPLQRTLQLNESWRLLAVMPFINNQDIDLPGGFDNGLELALDRAELVAAQDIVFEQVPFERQESVRQALVFSPVLFRNPDPPVNEQTWARYCPALPRACPSIYTIEPDLSGEYWIGPGGPASFGFRGRQDLIYQERWETRTDNLRAIRVERLDGAPLSSSSFILTIDGEQVEAYQDLLWQDLRLADASELIELIAATSKAVRRFPNNPEIPDQVFEPTGVGFTAGFTDLSLLPQWGSPGEGDTWMLPFYFEETTPERPGPVGVDRVTFSIDGSAFAHRQNISLQWSLSDGRLLLNGDNIDTHGYQIVGDSLVAGGHQHSLASVRSESNLVWVLDRSIVQADGPAEFDEANVPGRYVSGFDLDRVLPLNINPVRFQVFQLEQGGDGWFATLEDVQEPDPGNTSPLDWTVNERGEIVIRRDFGSGFVQWRSWAAATLVNGQDQYVLEVGPVFVSDDPDYEIPFVPGRLNFYRKVVVAEP